MANTEVPKRKLIVHNHHFNGEKWDPIEIREGDIIVTTAYKTGTTWTQNILATLMYQGQPIPPEAAEMGPWIDLRVPPIEAVLPAIQAMEGKRQFKSHLRFDALNYSPKARYLYICRDPRDAFMSLISHYQIMNDAMFAALNTTPGLVGEPLARYSEKYESASAFFDDWISKGSATMEGETDGYPFWSIFDHARTWWEYRHLPNIKFIHFNDMLSDLPGAIREIAAFVDLDIHEEFFEETVRKNTFEVMKETAASNPILTIQNHLFVGGASAFVNKGTNGRWGGVLTEKQLEKYDEVVRAKFSPDCAAWFEKGKASGVDPKTV